MLLLFAQFYSVSQRQSLNLRLQINQRLPRAVAVDGSMARYVYVSVVEAIFCLSVLVSESVFVSVSLDLSVSPHTDVSI